MVLCLSRCLMVYAACQSSFVVCFSNVKSCGISKHSYIQEIEEWVVVRDFECLHNKWPNIMQERCIFCNVARQGTWLLHMSFRRLVREQNMGDIYLMNVCATTHTVNAKANTLYTYLELWLRSEFTYTAKNIIPCLTNTFTNVYSII